MSTSKRIVWIDDDPRRKRTADDLDADFINVHGEDLAQKAVELLKGPQPALVILDHILDKTTPKNRLFQRGSTIAEAIKEQWPSCPVVGVTNVDNVKAIDLRTQGTYDALFPFQNLGECIDRIDAIRKGFALIAGKKARTVRKLVGVLKPPADDVERLVAALPDDLKKSSKDASVASRLYRWVDDYLMARPGFLYDTLWAATFLGLTKSGFQKVAGRFKKGRYAGVFAHDNDPRWWSSQLAALLYKQCEPKLGEISWQTGRRMNGIKEQRFSRCHVCHDAYPETVAYIDEMSEDRQAMHLKCSILHPRHKRELYFEDIRMMQGE